MVALSCHNFIPIWAFILNVHPSIHFLMPIQCRVAATAGKGSWSIFLLSKPFQLLHEDRRPFPKQTRDKMSQGGSGSTPKSSPDWTYLENLQRPSVRSHAGTALQAARMSGLLTRYLRVSPAKLQRKLTCGRSLSFCHHRKLITITTQMRVGIDS